MNWKCSFFIFILILNLFQYVFYSPSVLIEVNENFSLEISKSGTLSFIVSGFEIPGFGFAYWRRNWEDFTHQEWWSECRVCGEKNDWLVEGGNDLLYYKIKIRKISYKMVLANIVAFVEKPEEIEALAWGSWSLEVNKWKSSKIKVFSWSRVIEVILPVVYNQPTIFQEGAVFAYYFPGLAIFSFSSGKGSIVDERAWERDSYSIRFYLEPENRVVNITLLFYNVYNISKVFEAYKALKKYFIYSKTLGESPDFVKFFLNENFVDAEKLVIKDFSKSFRTCKSLKWVKVNENRFVDEDGFQVFLYGANYMGMEFGWFNHREEDFRRMSSWGFNIVRIPIGWQYIEPSNGIIDEDYLLLIDRIIYLAKKSGLYVVLDMHQYKWGPKYGGCGIPDWVIPDASDYREASIRFFTSIECWREFADIWRIIAKRYRNESAIIAYDIFNEPIPYYELMSPRDFRKAISNFYNYVIKEIRKVDNRHIVFFMSAWGSDKETVPEVFDENSALTVHFYYGGTWDGVTGYEHVTYKDLEKEIEYWIRIAKNISKPLWFGEFGVGSSAYKSFQWAMDVAEMFDKYAVGYAWWTYWRDASYFGLLYPDGSEKEIVEVLKRPRVYRTNATLLGSKYILNENFYIANFLLDNNGRYLVELDIPLKFGANPVITVRRCKFKVEKQGDRYFLFLYNATSKWVEIIVTASALNDNPQDNLKYLISMFSFLVFVTLLFIISLHILYKIVTAKYMPKN